MESGSERRCGPHCHLAAKDRDRGGGQGKSRIGTTVKNGGRGRSIGVGGSAIDIWTPVVFGLAEHDRAHGTGETAGSVTNGIVETDCDLVFVFLVFVDHQ